MNYEQTASATDISVEWNSLSVPAAAAGAGAAPGPVAGAGKLPIPDTPIVSIASGIMSVSTTTTTSTKTTPTPFSEEQLKTMMSHHVTEENAEADGPMSNARKEKKIKSREETTTNEEVNASKSSTQDDGQGAALEHSSTNHMPISNSSRKQQTPTNSSHSTKNATITSAPETDVSGAGSAANTEAAPLSQVFALLGDSSRPELAKADSRCRQYGTTAKGKTQDDQNVGKRQKKKKTKYDAWEDSDFNDLDDASLKKLLEEAYWYRNPGDRKNKSERFLQMLKKAEYDEEISYRAIKTCLTLNPTTLTSGGASAGGGNSVCGSTSVHNTSYNQHQYSHSSVTNHRTADTSGQQQNQRHKQGGSLQDLVAAAHRSELPTTSAAAAAATSAVSQRFNCDYQLIGRSNRRSHQHNQNAACSLSSTTLKKTKNSSVSGRQREGGSLPCSVNNFESAVMDSRQQKQHEGPEQIPAKCETTGKQHNNHSNTGSCCSLPGHLGDVDASQCGLSMDEDEACRPVKRDYLLEHLEKHAPPTPHSMTFMGAKLLQDGIGSQQAEGIDTNLEASRNEGATGVHKEASVEDPLHFGVLESRLQQQAYYLAALTGQFGLGVEQEPKPKVEAGYVSLNDSYTACSSVYGGGAGSLAATETGKASTSSSANSSSSSDVFGRMVSAVASSAAASLGGKATTRQLDENGNALGDGYGGSSTSAVNSNGNQFTALITTTVGSAPTSSAVHRQMLSTGSNTTTTAMAAAAVAASYSQLQHAPGAGTASVSSAGSGISHPSTKLKAKKKSQDRNTKTVDVESQAGYRGKDPVEQLVKYIENDGNSGGNNVAAQQKKKERKKQNKLKKSNSLEELRSCSKMEVGDLKQQSATTEMMRQKKGTNNGASSTSGSSGSTALSSTSNHNSVSVADISKNCNKEPQLQSQPQQQQQSSVQVRFGNSGSQQRKGERRSWGTEELQYLEHHQDMSATWSEPETLDQKLPLSLSRMSELDALNTVLSETAEFHVVTKKKKPKKQRAVTMDDAAVAAAAHTGGNLQRMQQITKSASSNMMSQKMHYYTSYNNSTNNVGNYYKQQHQYQEHHPASQQQHPHHQHHHHHHHHHSGSTVASQVDSSRRKSTSSMPPSEKSDSSDLDSVHSLPIQTGKKKNLSVGNGVGNNNQRGVVSAANQRQGKQNYYSLSPAPISYADIARNKQEAQNNSNASDTEMELGGKSSKFKARPDFPELPGAASSFIPAAAGNSFHLTGNLNQNTAPSYSQSLNATPLNSDVEATTNSPELPSHVQVEIVNISSGSGRGSCPLAGNSSIAGSLSSQPALQKSKSVEHDASYSFNSSNLDQQYPALKMTVKRHSTNNVSLPTATILSTSSGCSSSLYNFAAAAKQQQLDKSATPTSVTTAASGAFTPASVPVSASAPAPAPGPTSASSASPASVAAAPKMKNKHKELIYNIITKKSSAKPSQEEIEDTIKTATSLVTITTQKSTTATQTDGAKKLIKLPGGALESTVGRRAVIILNDDRDASSSRGNTEFSFGDFNEDELKLFDDNEGDEEVRQVDQEMHSSNKHQQTGSQAQVEAGNVEAETERDDQEDEQAKHEEKCKLQEAEPLNDSGAASDVVDILSISANVAQSSPHAALTTSSSSAASLISSLTPSASGSSSSSSVSISSAASGSGSSASSSLGNVGACLSSVSGLLANQSGDSGIYVTTNTSVKEQVNHFLSKASSSEDMLPAGNAAISVQQLETCNDIEAAIIAAARAAAAARSTSCSRRNSQEQILQQEVQSNPTSGVDTKALSLPVVMTYKDGDDDDQDTLQDLSFMADLRTGTVTPTLPESGTLLPATTPSSRPAVMTNTELIVDYIANTWNAIANSKYVTYYNEQEQET